MPDPTQNQSARSMSVPSAQPSARSPLAGCLILVLAVMVMVFLVGFSVYTLFRQYAEIEKFTSDEPVPLEISVMEEREPELNRLAERLEGFRQELLVEKETESVLVLDAEELNLAIAAYAPLKELRGTFRVLELNDGLMRIGISFPLNGRPRLAKDDEEGWIKSDMRFLNGVMVARPILSTGEIVMMIDRIEVPGAAVPPEFVMQMSPYRITERYTTDELLGPAMKRLTFVEVADGRLVMRRTPGEIAAGEITVDQVGKATNRLFTFFGIGASVFLVLVGLVIFVGLRSKGRTASPP